MTTRTFSWREWIVFVVAVDGIDIVKAFNNDYSEKELKAFFEKNALKLWIVKTVLFVNLDKLGQKLIELKKELGLLDE